MVTLSVVWSGAYVDLYWAGVRNTHLILARSLHSRFSSTLFAQSVFFSEPFRIPLSAFIVEDMAEFVQAHASYRFIISDEEDERPRILVWLFKPNLQLAYATSKRYAIPKSGSMHAAKVLYKLIGPTEGQLDLKTILDRYPGFPQAEYLFYPMDTCQRLAVLLRESNRTYPENMRSMTGLEVGWLQRA